jgi:AcrR family transcriptional regulator
VAEDEEIEEDEDVEEAHNGHDDEDDEEEKDDDEDEDDDEDLEAGYEDTLPTTKKAMIELLVKGMNKLTKEQIRTAHKNILTTVESAKASKKEESARAVKVKESIKVNVEDDVEALLNGEEDISEEFKKKTTTIFEAAVREKVETEVDRLEKEYEQSVAEEINEVRDDLVEKIDSYLDYVVEEWLKDNEVAIESGIRSEVTEEFISGLKRLFEEHYIDIPEDKVDVLSDLTKENEDLKEQVNNEINKNIELKKEKDSVSASEVFNDVVDGLADTEIEKMKSLGEGIEFEDEDSYREAISTLRENYFPKTRVAEEEVVEVEESPEDELNGPMATYYKAINRFNTQV